jgi:hypothetical protein
MQSVHISNSAPNVGGNGVNEAAARKAEAKLAKADLLKWWSAYVKNSALLEEFEGKSVLPNAVNFMRITLPGTTLRNLMVEDVGYANSVLKVMSKGVVRMELKGGFNNDLLISNPLGAFLDFRQEFRDRIVKKESVFGLTQKQDKILLRIGRTVDLGLERAELELGHNNRVTLFKTLWLAHLDELERHYVGDDCIAPQHVTFMLLELLFQTCSLDGIQAFNPSLVDRLVAWTPMQKLYRKIHRYGRKLNSMYAPIE